ERPSRDSDPAEDPRTLEHLLEAARRETAPSHLAERVFDHVKHRSHLEQLADSPPFTRPARSLPSLGSVVGALALATAAAAATAVVVRSTPTAIAPERISEPVPAAPAKNVVHRAPEVDPCLERVVAPGASPLIDDFEDGDDQLAVLEQRVGYWRWVREIDAPGTAPALLPLPRPEATASNRFALHVKGGRLVDWGAAVEVTFRPACYDASAHGGIAFEARGSGRVYIAPRETRGIPRAAGGTCDSACHNPRVARIGPGGGFRTYESRWEGVRQRGFGTLPRDPTRLNGIAFLVRPEDTPYDVWIDDVRFLPRER